MAQLLDLLSDALTAIGQLGVGQTISPEQSQQGLRLSQRIIGKLSIRRPMMYTITQRAFNLTPGQQNYTLGPTGTLGAAPQTRPVFIQAARVSGVGSANEAPLALYDETEWGGIRDKGATNSALGLPNGMWNDSQYPNVGLHFWPIPSAAINLILATWELIQNFVTIYDVINMPPGYDELLVQLLAIEWCPYFDMPITQAMSQNAADIIQSLQQFNVQEIGGSFGEAQALNVPNLVRPNLPPSPQPPQPPPG
jgi:hypothetical protein